MVAVIIPCYNTGIYLREAIESVKLSGFSDYEIVVVNDGSTQRDTLDVLKNIEGPNIRVIQQENKGLGSARNFGVGSTSAEYILFLDSDNRVRKGYFEQAVSVFQKNPNVGVVYAMPFFFGDDFTSRFNPKSYSFDSLLAGNYIDACSFVRRIAFMEVGGFDENRALKISEDWDLWLRIGLSQWQFFFLNEVLFDYRIRGDSMIGTSASGSKEETFRYLGLKYGYLIHEKYRQYYRVMDKIQEKPFSYFIRILYYKYILRKPFIS